MKNTLFSLLIIALIPLFVFSNDLDPNAFPSSNTTITASTQRDIGTYDPIRNTRWGTDVQIYSGYVNAISYDYNLSNHNMYSLVITNHGDPNDTLIIFKSSDLGDSFYVWYAYPMPYNSAHNAKLLVTDKADSVWVSYIALFTGSPGGDLYCARIPESDSSAPVLWKDLSNGDQDTVYYFDAAYRDSFMYVAYCAKDTSIYSGSLEIISQTFNLNHNNGSWQNKTGLFGDPLMEKPAIAAGGNGNVFVALLENWYHTDTANVRLKKSTDCGASWQTTVPVSNNSGNYPLGNLSIAASNDSIVWVGVDFDLGTDYNWGYYYSVDTGATFIYSGTYYTNNHQSWDQDLGSMVMSKGNGIVTVAFKEDTSTTHNVVFGWIQPSEPSHFYNDSLEVINDYAATGTFSPVAATKITYFTVPTPMYIENSAVLYAGWGPSNVYFDGYNFTGVKDKVGNEKTAEFAISSTSISRNNVDIKLTLGKTANVNAAIYRLNGQKIKTLVSGERISGVYNLRWNRRDNNNNRVASGIYLIRVSADNNVKTAKIALIK